MNRLLLSLMCVAVFLSCGIRAAAQTFTFVPTDTVLSGPLGTEVVFNATLKNVSSNPLTAAFVRTVNALPADWQSSLCIGIICYAPSIDSVATSRAFGSDAVNPGDTCAFSLHVNAMTNPGTGVVHVAVKDVDNPGFTKEVTFTTTATATGAAIESSQPLRFFLEQNYPNPWNPSTQITYSLPSAGPVRLSIYDLLGRTVAVLVDRSEAMGSHTVMFDGRSTPTPLSSGLYVFRLDWHGRSEARTMMFIQ